MVLLLALIGPACTGDAGEATTTTTTIASTTSTSVAATTTVDGGTGIPIPEAPPASCFYLDGFIALEEGQGDAAVAALEEFDVELAVVSAAEVLGDSEAVEPLDNAIDLLSTSVDSLDVATALGEVQITAGPIYAMGYAAHWRLKPGTDPISRPGAQIPNPDRDLGEGVIAVVDSGIVVEPLPDWMSPEHVLYDPTDIETIGPEPNVASHGTFVTSLIRQLAPEYRVAFASAKPTTLENIVQRDDEVPDDVTYISTELHVAEAMIRLTQRPELDDGNLLALNLSLGTYTCNPGRDPTMVTTMASMRLWFASFPNSTVFAAGGNEAYEAPFWPAGLSRFQLDPTIQTDWVRGVGAANGAGDQVVWGPAAVAPSAVAPKPAPQRLWITDVAPGCDLLGLRGGTAADTATVVAWSGSSFATAVNAALDAAGVPPTSVGPPGEYDYSVPNLLFEELGSCDLP